MSTDDTPGQQPSNADLERTIQSGFNRMDDRLKMLEAWRDTHEQESEGYKATVDTKLGGLSERIETQHLSVLKQVSATINALVQDAIRTALQEDFAVILQERFSELFKRARATEVAARKAEFIEWFHEARRQERADLIDDIRTALKRARQPFDYLKPILATIVTIIGLYGIFFH